MDYKCAGWYSRHYVPRFDGDAVPQLLTLHLVDALPDELRDCWQQEVQGMDAADADAELRRRLERYLDTGDGAAGLGHPGAAGEVETALLAADADLLVLHAWVVMPNHLHALFTPFATPGMDGIVATVRKATTRVVNGHLERVGDLWHPDYYAQPMRNDEHYARTITYIEQNPVKAGLCSTPAAWRWGSARLRGSAGYAKKTSA